MKRLLLSALFFGLPAQSVMADDIYGDSAACAAGSNSPAALVYFEGMKDRKGKIRLELFPANDKDFLADDVVLQKAGKTFRRIELSTPQAGPIALCLKAPRAGTYSMAIIHDRDSLRKFSFTVDGIGFPGNPKLGMSKPKSAQALVRIGDGVSVLHVRLNYFTGFGFGPLKKAR